MTGGLASATGPAGGSGKSVLRRDIEGLRAVAVLLVLLYHLGVPGFAAGFAGVDVFFVISGFLITGLLIREGQRTGRIALGQFYARRARRLLPIALLVILVTVLLGWWVLPATELRHLGHDALGSTFYVVNWVLAARAVDYLAEDAVASPLQHYWSLSIEEQFYLFWPLLLLVAVVLARHRGWSLRPVLLVLLTPVVLASFGWSLHLTGSDPVRAYFVSTTRVWQLGAGALLAVVAPALGRLRRPVSQVLALTGTGLLVATVLVVDGSSAWPGTAALLPTLGVAAIIAAGCAPHPTVVGQLLGQPALVLLGGLSYAIYLWHWPLIVLTEARWGASGPLVMLGLGVGSVLLAWLSKHTVEDPIRHHRALAAARPRRSLFSAAATMLLVGAVAGGLLASRPTLVDAYADAQPPSRTGSSPDNATGADRGEEEGTGDATPDPGAADRYWRGAAALVADPAAVPWRVVDDPEQAYTRSGDLIPAPELATEDSPSYYDDGCQIDQGVAAPRFDCVYGDRDSSTEILLVGDSKAGQHFSALQHIADQEGWRLTTYLKSACPLTVAGGRDADCDEFGQAVVEHVEDQPQPPHLVLLSTGASDTPVLREGMLEVVRRLSATGTSVVVLQDTPAPPTTRYTCAAEHPDDLTPCEFVWDQEKGGRELLARVAEVSGSPTIDLARWVCPDQENCPVAVGGQLLWRQGSHLTDTYVRSLTPFLYRELAALDLTSRSATQIPLDDVPRRTR